MDRKKANRIAMTHPARDIIARMLVRRGDHPGVASARGLSIASALLECNMLKTASKDFLPFDTECGIIQLGDGPHGEPPADV